MHASVSALFIHPLKSAAGIAVDAADVEPRGLRNDRRWLLVDDDSRFVTGRQQSRLPLIRAEPTADGLHLQAPGMPELSVARPPADAERIDATIWKDTVSAARAGVDADRWASRFLQCPVRLLYMDDAAARPVDPDYATAGDEVSFADGFPLLLLSQAALDGLNARLSRPVTMQRFRPNIVVDGCDAHAEDGWHRVRIGDVEFDVVKDCKRCVFTTVDPQRGERDADGEPLRTLLDYRRRGNGATFGRNLLPRSRGVVRVGDPVEVLAG